MLATSIRMASQDLVLLQQAGEHHLGLSMTKACPLSCGHCSAATVPASMHGSVSIPSADVLRYCAEMPELARRGLTSISLTGGEPVLALDHVAALSRAAREAGIRTTLVTGLYWAAGAATRRKVIAALPCVDSWNISWDRFHAAEVKLANVAIAQAAHLARNFKRAAKGMPRIGFEYHNKGTMATVGKRKAVVDLPGISFQGFLAWLTWMSVHLMLLLNVRNKLIVFFNWTMSYFANDSTLRLMLKADRNDTPMEKLEEPLAKGS